MIKSERNVVDVSELPRHTFGSSEITWWGNLAFMLVEGTTLAICAVVYIYLRRNFAVWPPLRTPKPQLLMGTLNMIALLVMTGVAFMESKSARRLDPKGVKFWSTLVVLADIAVVVTRALELGRLNTRWDNDAYGSIVWWTLGFHATLIALVFFEDVFFWIVALVKPLTVKEASHIVEKSEYAYFIAAIWLPLYILIYLSPSFI